MQRPEAGAEADAPASAEHVPAFGGPEPVTDFPAFRDRLAAWRLSTLPVTLGPTRAWTCITPMGLPAWTRRRTAVPKAVPRSEAGTVVSAMPAMPPATAPAVASTRATDVRTLSPTVPLGERMQSPVFIGRPAPAVRVDPPHAPAGGSVPRPGIGRPTQGPVAANRSQRASFDPTYGQTPATAPVSMAKASPATAPITVQPPGSQPLPLLTAAAVRPGAVPALGHGHGAGSDAPSPSLPLATGVPGMAVREQPASSPPPSPMQRPLPVVHHRTALPASSPQPSPSRPASPPLGSSIQTPVSLPQGTGSAGPPTPRITRPATSADAAAVVHELAHHHREELARALAPALARWLRPAPARRWTRDDAHPEPPR